MRALLIVLMVAVVAAGVYGVVVASSRAHGGRKDRGRLRRERNAALEGLHNVRDIVSPYLTMGGDATLLAEMVYSEVRKTEDKLRKELA